MNSSMDWPGRIMRLGSSVSGTRGARRAMRGIFVAAAVLLTLRLLGLS